MSAFSKSFAAILGACCLSLVAAPAAAELKSLSERLDHLWDEERTLKAELRFGDRNHIVARARVEERLERAA